MVLPPALFMLRLVGRRHRALLLLRPLIRQSRVSTVPFCSPHTSHSFHSSLTAEDNRLQLERQLHSLLGLGLAAPVTNEPAQQPPVRSAPSVLGEPLLLFDNNADASFDAALKGTRKAEVALPPKDKEEAAVPAPKPAAPKKTVEPRKSSNSTQTKKSSAASKQKSKSSKSSDSKKSQKLHMSMERSLEASQSMDELFAERSLPIDDSAERQATLRRLQTIMDKCFAGMKPRLQVFGSSVNGFGSQGCDMDMVVMLDCGKDPHSHLVELLEAALVAAEYPDLLALPKARVPVVKFRDPATGLGCDVCFNNELALRNSGLLATYAACDSRLRPLALAVKMWARARRVNNTFEGTLSSYAYVLMTVQFLQSRRPAILPVLQEMTAEAFRGRNRRKVMVSGFDTYYYQNVDDPRLQAFGENNDENLGQLLFEFFMFYGFFFVYKDRVISPRTGRILTKEDKGWTKPVDKANRSNYWFCLEDPFELSHNLGRTVDKGSIFNLRYEFRRGASILAGTFDFRESHGKSDDGLSMIDMLLTPFDKEEKQLKL